MEFSVKNKTLAMTSKMHLALFLTFSYRYSASSLTSLSFNSSPFSSSYSTSTTFTFGSSALTSTTFAAIDSNLPLTKFTMKINIGTWARPPIITLVSE